MCRSYRGAQPSLREGAKPEGRRAFDFAVVHATNYV